MPTYTMNVEAPSQCRRSWSCDKEANVTVPANAQAEATAKCPKGDDVVGGGGYQVTQNTEEDLNSSYASRRGSWSVIFNNGATSADTGVAVAICVAASSLTGDFIQTGSIVNVPPNSTVESTATCAIGCVALGGGWYNEGTAVADNNGASDPLGPNGWRAYPAAGSSATAGYAQTVCAVQPKKWAQISSSYVVNPSNTATTVTVPCPKGTKVLGGGNFNDSSSSLVNIGHAGRAFRPQGLEHHREQRQCFVGGGRRVGGVRQGLVRSRWLCEMKNALAPAAAAAQVVEARSLEQAGKKQFPS